MWPWPRRQQKKFHKILWFMMLHQYTKFGYKRLKSLKDSAYTNIHLHFEPLLWPWPWTQQFSFLTQHSSLWWYTIKLSLVAKGLAFHKIQKEQSYFDYINPHCDLDLKVSTPISLHDTPPPDYLCTTLPGLDTERSAALKIMPKENPIRGTQWFQYTPTPPHPNFVTGEFINMTAQVPVLPCEVALVDLSHIEYLWLVSSLLCHTTVGLD